MTEHECVAGKVTTDRHVVVVVGCLSGRRLSEAIQSAPWYVSLWWGGIVERVREQISVNQRGWLVIPPSRPVRQGRELVLL